MPLSIDKVIHIIRNADEPKAALIAEFRLPTSRPKTCRFACAQLARLNQIQQGDRCRKRHWDAARQISVDETPQVIR
jgi:topoisomerase-4 subunit A